MKSKTHMTEFKGSPIPVLDISETTQSIRQQQQAIESIGLLQFGLDFIGLTLLTLMIQENLSPSLIVSATSIFTLDTIILRTRLDLLRQKLDQKWNIFSEFAKVDIRNRHPNR